MGRLNALGITFITLRRRSPQLRKAIALLPRSAWRTVELEVPTRKYRFPRVFEQPVELVKGHAFRQMFIEDLGHDEATILLTNDRRGAAAVITRYAQRMLIENALSDAVRFFHLDALSSAVGLKVDFDMALLVIASGLYRLLARTMRGYADAQARQIFRDLLDMPATVNITPAGVVVSFPSRPLAHRPRLRPPQQAGQRPMVERLAPPADGVRQSRQCPPMLGQFRSVEIQARQYRHRGSKNTERWTA